MSNCTPNLKGKKGRNSDLIEKRNYALIKRFYYLTEVNRRRFDDAMKILSNKEFFISEQTIENIIKQNISRLEQLRSKETIKKKKSICVMLRDPESCGTQFTIEGFSKKDVTDDDLQRYIINHFEYLYGNNSAKIKSNGSDYIVEVESIDKMFNITWTWKTSYLYA